MKVTVLSSYPLAITHLIARGCQGYFDEWVEGLTVTSALVDPHHDNQSRQRDIENMAHSVTTADPEVTAIIIADRVLDDYSMPDRLGRELAMPVVDLLTSALGEVSGAFSLVTLDGAADDAAAAVDALGRTLDLRAIRCAVAPAGWERESLLQLITESFDCDDVAAVVAIDHHHTDVIAELCEFVDADIVSPVAAACEEVLLQLNEVYL